MYWNVTFKDVEEKRWSDSERGLEAMKIRMKMFPYGLSHLSLTEQETAKRIIDDEVEKAEKEYFSLLERNGRL